MVNDLFLDAKDNELTRFSFLKLLENPPTDPNHNHIKFLGGCNLAM
jgi:hypothetical protein